MATIYVTDRVGKEHVLELENGRSLMEPLREIDDGIEALCGGMCSCATCHVYIDANWTSRLDERRDDELDLVEDTECFINLYNDSSYCGLSGSWISFKNSMKRKSFSNIFPYFFVITDQFGHFVNFFFDISQSDQFM